METIILILGVFSSVTLIISALSTGRKRMLIFGLATSVLCLIQFALNQSTLALIIGLIGLVRTGFALLSLKYPIMNTWPFLVMFLGAHTTAFIFTTNWDMFIVMEALPVLGAYLGTLAVFFKRMAVTKSLMIACGAVWLCFQFYSGFYTQMVGEIFTLGANIFALTMILRAEKSGMKDEEFEALDEQVLDALTGSIPVVKIKEALTGSIPVINIPTNTMPIPIISANNISTDTRGIPQIV